jgi:hypothetical protein
MNSFFVMQYYVMHLKCVFLIEEIRIGEDEFYNFRTKKPLTYKRPFKIILIE